VNVKKNAHNKIPFYPQKWDLSQWKEMGFESYADAEYWERSSCGALCLKMVVDALLAEHGRSLSSPVSEFIKRGVSIGAYSDELGWLHKGMIEFAALYGVSAKAHRHAKPLALKEFLSKGYLPIVSIKVGFVPKKRLRERILFWRKLGDHLALLVGYEEENGKLLGFYVNHTSIYGPWNWEQHFVPIDMFKKGFTGSCVVVGEPEDRL
jgi:hypothetical protein